MGALKSGRLLAGAAAAARVWPARLAGGLTPLRLLALAALAATAALGRCAPVGPRPIVYDKDACAYCSMIASDARFGAELVTRTGRVYVFDSPECLAGYLRAHPAEAQRAQTWVTDFTRPGTLLPAASATFRQTTAVSSPMGLGVAALGPGRALPDAMVGPQLSWHDVMALAAQRAGDDGDAP